MMRIHQNRYYVFSRFFLVILLFIVILSGILSSCDNREASLSDRDKVKVITTLFPLYDFARHIAGEKAQVEMLMPPGVEPHSFEPKPQDIARLQKTDILIFTGINMEPWVEKILKGLDNKNLIVVDSSNGLRFIPAQEDHDHKHTHTEGDKRDSHDHFIDPHVWLDFDNAQKMADNIFIGLSKKDPGNAALYKKNLEDYKARLVELDSRYKEALKDCKKRVFVGGGHRLFGYIASRYNLRYLSAYGISPDSQPSAKAMASLTRMIKGEGLGYVFVEELISPKVAETLSRETGAGLLILKGAHNLTAEEFTRGITFIDIMNENLKNLKKGLQCP